jgi:hypothetical protein
MYPACGTHSQGTGTRAAAIISHFRSVLAAIPQQRYNAMARQVKSIRHDLGDGHFLPELWPVLAARMHEMCEVTSGLLLPLVWGSERGQPEQCLTAWSMLLHCISQH